MIKNRLVFTIFYLLISMTILVLDVDNSLKKNDKYFESVFSSLTDIVEYLGEFNAYNASRIQEFIDSGEIYQLENNKVAKMEIGYYSERNEFGFNQGIYPEAPPQGVLIGGGRPTDITLNNVGQFLFLDREWSYFDQSSIFTHHFLVNHSLNYIYLSYRIDNSYDQPLFEDAQYGKEQLRSGIAGTEQAQVDDAGYFYTTPYNNYLIGGRVASVISPIYVDNQHIADIGLDIEFIKLSEMVELFPTLKSRVGLSIEFKYDDQEYILSEAQNDFWTVSKYKYRIENLGYFVASYDVTLILADTMPIFLLLLFLYIMIFINNRRMKEEKKSQNLIRKQLNLDSMTNLYNRRGLEKIITNDIPIYREKNELIFIIALDANKFKYINDTHGHMVGDKALIFIAEAMEECTRDSDYCIRMGGDEFLIILPGTSKDVVERVETRIEEYLAKFSKLKVGVSVTVTQASVLFKSDELFDVAYSRADKLMYEKKALLNS